MYPEAGYKRAHAQSVCTRPFSRVGRGLGTRLRDTVPLKELCHHISVFLVTEAGWGPPLSNQVRGQCGFNFVTSRSRHLLVPVPGRPS